jgi:intracellular sulfur oxidation DsrE/DsrF family protein
MKFNLLLHVDADDAAVFSLAFSQAASYRKEALLRHHSISAQDIALDAAFISLEDLDTFKMVMVVNGAAVKQLVRENTGLLAKAKEAAANGLRLHVGQCALDRHGLAKEQIWDMAEVVPSATLDMVQLQHEGYAYIKV